MILYGLLAAAAVVDLVVFMRAYSAYRRLTIAPVADDTKLADMPTVSICITARNETHAMTQCLERVVATDYPKLEIIVLDDGSRDNTSMLIKSFAHAGVRFIEGKQLPAGWLGKNYAQSVLASEASGEVVFFLDVDTLIDRYTVTRAISYMQRYQTSMVSIIPIRDDAWRTSLLFATMRHMWTVLRFSPHAPRAAANAWLIDRHILVNEFLHDETLTQSVQVETTLAQKLAKDNKYRLVMSNVWLGLRYEKRWSSQVETSIRLLYPQHDKQLYKVVWTLAVFILLLSPYVVVWWQPWALAVIALHYLLYLYHLSHTWGRYRLVGALLLPYTLAQEVVLLIISTYRYNFGTITWKGRPISSLADS